MTPVFGLCGLGLQIVRVMYLQFSSLSWKSSSLSVLNKNWKVRIKQKKKKKFFSSVILVAQPVFWCIFWGIFNTTASGKTVFIFHISKVLILITLLRGWWYLLSWHSRMPKFQLNLWQNVPNSVKRGKYDFFFPFILRMPPWLKGRFQMVSCTLENRSPVQFNCVFSVYFLWLSKGKCIIVCCYIIHSHVEKQQTHLWQVPA